MLDPNHNNFILVDDGSEGSFGKEIEFRASFESELRKGKSLTYYRKKFIKRNGKQSLTVKSNWTTANDDTEQENIPMVLIVVQGGPNTLFTVAESLSQNIPVLILAVSLFDLIFVFIFKRINFIFRIVKDVQILFQMLVLVISK